MMWFCLGWFQVACQAPKPILLDVGQITTLGAWAPSSLGIQVARIGQVILVAPPSEFTTMAGRRLKDQIAKIAVANGIPNPVVIIAGLANGYSGYTTTPEEYIAQRYEGASTMYGPNQFAAYSQELSKLTVAMLTGAAVDPGTNHLTPMQLSFITPVVVDGHPIGAKFGDVVTPPAATYAPGSTVLVEFVSSNPRNDLRTGGTFLEVQRVTGPDSYVTVATDAVWETKFTWRRVGVDESVCGCIWDIPKDTAPGKYRIVHYNAAKENPFSSTLTQVRPRSP